MRKTDRHAVYLITDGPCFRIGQPTDWDTAIRRWDRLNPATTPRVRVRWYGRWYAVQWAEVRSVDVHGIGQGSERHGRAIPVPYRAVSRLGKRTAARRLVPKRPAVRLALVAASR